VCKQRTISAGYSGCGAERGGFQLPEPSEPRYSRRERVEVEATIAQLQGEGMIYLVNDRWKATDT